MTAIALNPNPTEAPPEIVQDGSAPKAELSETGFGATVITNTAPSGKMCKCFSISEDGEIASETNAQLHEGTAAWIHFDSIEDFMSQRRDLGPNQALIFGRPHYSEARVVTQAALSIIPTDQRVAERIIARDRAHFSWSDTPALVMLDLDYSQGIPSEVSALLPQSPEEWWAWFGRNGFTDMDQVQRAWAPSSSSYVYREEEELHGLRGQRFYFAIDKGLGIPRFAEALHDRLVLAGLVWFEISKSGSLLKRTPFDLAVFQPERIDFAAGPVCTPPLEWRPKPPKVWAPEGVYLTSGTLPEATLADRRLIDATIEAARRRKLPESRAIKDGWKEGRAREIMARSADISLEQAGHVAEAALERGILLPDFVLKDSGGDLVSVAHLLENAEANNGRRFCDPLEPEYRNDMRIAVFQVWPDGRATVSSHAHGGQYWTCLSSTPRVELGLAHKTVDALHEAVKLADCGIFRHGDTLVTIPDSEARVTRLTSDGLRLLLQRSIRIVKRNDGNGREQEVDLPDRPLKGLLAEATALGVPVVDAVVTGPFALADGTIVDVPGYNVPSQVMYVSEVPYPPQVRRNIGPTEAVEALRALWKPVSQYPFVSDVDRGVVLAALLSSVVRASIDIGPSYCFTAHTAGTGKTLLAQVIATLHTGQPASTSALPADDDEIRKHVFSKLRQGSQFLVFDNAERGNSIESPVLANIITSPLVEDRVLQLSVTERQPNRLTFVFTGNNIVLHGDLNRRVLTATIDARMEQPWTREFSFHPVDYVRANWLQLRIAALELFAGWVAAGRPKAPGHSGFPQWDATVRSVLCWASELPGLGVTFADPLLSISSGYEQDPETEALGALLVSWFELFGGGERLLKDVDDAIRTTDGLDPLGTPNPTNERDSEGDISRRALADALAEVLAQKRGDWQMRRRTLGKYFEQNEGRIVGGLKLARGGKTGGTRRWKVVQVEEVGPGQ